MQSIIKIARVQIQILCYLIMTMEIVIAVSLGLSTHNLEVTKVLNESLVFDEGHDLSFVF